MEADERFLQQRKKERRKKERLTETIKLIKIYNPSKIIFSGGSGSLNPDALPHTFVAKKFFSEMGIRGVNRG